MAGRNVLVFVAGDVAVRIGGAAFVPHPLFIVGRDAVEFDATHALAGDFVGVGADFARRLLAAVEIDQQPAPRRVFEQVGVEVDLAYAFAVHEVHLDALYAYRRDRVQKAAHLAVVVRRIVEFLPMAPYEQPHAAGWAYPASSCRNFHLLGRSSHPSSTVLYSMPSDAAVSITRFSPSRVMKPPSMPLHQLQSERPGTIHDVSANSPGSGAG